jgi:uncharacterized paraquat-inducible protein A
MRSIAHAGEEILYVMAPALVFLAVYLIRANRERKRAEADGRGEGDAVAAGSCPYCGGPVEASEERCPRCGFKIRREAGGA